MKRTLALIAIASMCSTLLGGCSAKPVVSDSKTWGNATLEEQRNWINQQADTAIEVLGQSDGWWEFDPSYPWPQDRESIMEDAPTKSCRPNSGGEQPGQLSLRLRNETFTDPFAAAERVKQYWISEGWEVTNVLEPGDDETATVDRIEYFRADRADGSGLALKAHERLVVLIIDTACSNDGTVVYRY